MIKIKTLVDRKELAAIMNVEYMSVCWHLRNIPGEGKRNGVYVYDLHTTIEKLKNAIGRRKAPKRKKRLAPNIQLTPTWDDLPFYEQRRRRNPTEDEFEGVPPERRLAILNTLPRN